jgi:predicted porin
VTWGGGGSFEGHVEEAPGPDRKKQQFYQTGLNFTFGNFSVGGVFEYYNHALDRTKDNDVGPAAAVDAWVAGIGVGYTMDAWTFGAQYSHLDADNHTGDVISGFKQDRVVVTGAYQLGPGIVLDAEAAYTWLDTDPENFTNASGINFDDYDAIEIGLGTSLTF